MWSCSGPYMSRCAAGELCFSESKGRYTRSGVSAGVACAHRDLWLGKHGGESVYSCRGRRPRFRYFRQRTCAGAQRGCPGADGRAAGGESVAGVLLCRRELDGAAAGAGRAGIPTGCIICPIRSGSIRRTDWLRWARWWSFLKRRRRRWDRRRRRCFRNCGSMNGC